MVCSPQSLANSIRGLSIDAVEAAQSGHPGAPMGMADIAYVLFSEHLKFVATQPDWPDRDRLVLSNGHASMMLYSLLYLSGYPGVTLEQLKNFRQWGSNTPGHPEYGHTSGVEVTTGPLGQGLGAAVGMALAESRLSDEFGTDLCDHRTWVFAGDGCLMEGVGQEAASLAGHLGLGRLNVLYDMNGITIDGSTQLSFTENTASKFSALGWHVLQADGHDHGKIDDALLAAKNNTNQPTIILFDTIIGYGSPNKAGSSKAHGAALGAEEIQLTKIELGLPAEAFTIPDGALEEWRSIGVRQTGEYNAWQTQLDHCDGNLREEFLRRVSGTIPSDFRRKYKEYISTFIQDPQALATRKSSQLALDSLTNLLPELIGGSADLTGSNLTKTAATDVAFTRDTTGRYINYGVREFAMGAAMNGFAVHGGFIPYGGTFLVFSDYMRNAIRLSALMGIRVIYVMTHDSIGLGEDGPTHQPIEHLASLRAIPNLQVFRPADVVETLEAWEVAISSPKTPTLLALSRQAVPQLRTEESHDNLSARGGYVIYSSGKPRDITLLATGTEVSLAIEAAKLLHADDIAADVVSLTCWSLFDAQPSSYRESVLGTGPRIGVEAASSFGWAKYVQGEANVIAIDEFGASAPAEKLYQEYGITSQAIVARAKELTSNQQ